MFGTRARLRLCRTSWERRQVLSAIDVADKFASARINAVSYGVCGDPLPTRVARGEDGTLVLALLRLTETQDVTLLASNEAGEVIAVAHERVGANPPARRPLFEREGAKVELPAPSLVMSLSIERMVADGHGDGACEICHLTARAEAGSAADLDYPFELCAIDAAGRHVSSRLTVMRDEVHAEEEAFVRGVQLSLRIAGAPAAFTLWATSEGRTLGLVDIDEARAFELRQRSYLMTQYVRDNKLYGRRFQDLWAADAAELARERAQEVGRMPLLTVLTVVDDDSFELLRDTIPSVLEQTYAAFEYLLVDACSFSVDLAGWGQGDVRVRAVRVDASASMTEALRAGVSAARGELVCLLECGDAIAADALFRYAELFVDDDACDVLYSDEDCVVAGEHAHPWFKPQFEPDLLLGCDYLRHFLAVRHTLLDDLLEAGVELYGAWTHDLALRVTERARRVRRCPRILYHARDAVGAGYQAPDAAVLEEGIRAVQAHLARVGLRGSVHPNPRLAGRYECDFDLVGQPLVSVIIPNKDLSGVLDRCLRSLRERCSYDNLEILIVENNSTEERTFAYYEQAAADDARVRILHYEGAFNFAAINNFAAREACGDYLLLLNNDVEAIEAGWLERMVAVCARPTTGVVGAKLLYGDGTVQHGGVIVRMEGPCHANPYLSADEPLDNLQLMQDISAVTAACALVKRTVFDEMGGLDEALAVDYNDIDFCWRVHQAGYLVVYDPAVVLYHHESLSRGVASSKDWDLFERELGMLRSRWSDLIRDDPARNPNLDQESPYDKLRLS